MGIGVEKRVFCVCVCVCGVHLWTVLDLCAATRLLHIINAILNNNIAELRTSYVINPHIWSHRFSLAFTLFSIHFWYNACKQFTLSSSVYKKAKKRNNNSGNKKTIFVCVALDNLFCRIEPMCWVFRLFKVLFCVWVRHNTCVFDLHVYCFMKWHKVNLKR